MGSLVINGDRVYAAAAVNVSMGDRVVAIVEVIEGGDDAVSEPLKLVHIERAYHVDEIVVVAGWCAEPLQFGLHGSRGAIQHELVRIKRPDVATYLGRDSADDLGFVLVAHCPERKGLTLSWWRRAGDRPTQQILKLEARSNLLPVDAKAHASVVSRQTATAAPGSAQWHRLINSMPVQTGPCASARAYIEVAMTSEIGGRGILVGWVLHEPAVSAWIETEKGGIVPLKNAFRRARPDVLEAFNAEFTNPCARPGVIVGLDGVSAGERVTVKAMNGQGVFVLAEAKLGKLPANPADVARWLSSVDTPIAQYSQRIPLVDEPILRPLIEARCDGWSTCTVSEYTIGQPCARPEVSIIVPLYGRFDFVEHQLLEFARDPWLLAHAEVIYVIDDPRIHDSFRAEALALHKLYPVAFRVVAGEVNRGFSGANNLGASIAKGNHLLFLNSDVFPRRAGWIEPLLDVLQGNPKIGAVGPRLLHADGSIQHAGMQFLRREDLGIWVNHHPHAGLDPALDPHKTLAVVPAITGACILMRRKDFDRIGGWDTGYLVGDFEDSDLCLKLRAQGLDIAYLPTVELTHLERQTFKLLGGGDFRTRVVIFNAVRHQTRWAKLLESAVSEEIS